MEIVDRAPSRGGGAKPAWEAPRVAVVGQVKDLVQGFGKTGDTLDSDPQGTRKKGVG